MSVYGATSRSFKHLPSTLLRPCRVMPDAPISPCAGLGLNDTRMSGVKLAVPGSDLERNSFGLAVQLGGDIRLDRNWAASLDFKYVPIRVDLKAAGSTIGEVKLDPML